MSEFNHFAKELDAAFRTARSEYAAVYDELTKAKENASAAGLDAVKKQIATLQLQEAENSLRKETARIWTEFDAKAADLRRALEKEVQTSNLADPSAIDSNAVELMKTGVLTVDDYFGFADRYDGNPTMLKLIGHYAKEAADSTGDRKDRVALTVLAQDCAKGTGKTLKAWDSMMTVANYCSGRGYSGNRRITPSVTLSMGEWWDHHLAHHLEHGLVGDARAQLGAQAHGHLPVAAAVRRAREDLRDRPAQLGPGRSLRVRQRVVVARPCQARAFQQVGQGVLPRKPAHDRGFLAVRERFSAFRAIDFFR